MTHLSIDLPNGFLDDEAKTLIVPRHRKEVWAIELDLLVQLDSVCRRHDIRYFCDGGTLLGAVRHGGFIPWDDDIDVIMSRAEYEKLNAVAPSAFQHPYFWQTNETDPGSARGHAQLRNSCTTAILKSEMLHGKPIYRFNQGIFIDVFPFDALPDDMTERNAFRQRILSCKATIAHLRRSRIPISFLKNHMSICRTMFRAYQNSRIRVSEFIHGCDALNEACRKLEKQLIQFNDRNMKEMGPLSVDPYHHEILPASFFEEALELDFEFVKIPVMKHYIQSLEIHYGPNWREHVVGTSAHGGMFIDTDRPYTEYIPK